MEATQQATHTPGPWHRSMAGNFIRKSYETTGDGPKDFNICQMWRVGDDVTVEANAHLIAAAPNLLAACKELLAKIDRLYPNDWQGTKAIARAAIAQAEGK